MSRRTARRASTASRSCRSCASTRSSRGLPGDETDEQARFIEGVFSTEQRRAARRLALPAQRQSDRDREISLQAALDGAAGSAGRRNGCALEEPLVLAGDYNVIPEPIDAKNPAGLGRRRAVPAGDAGRRLRRLRQSRLHRRDPRGDRCDPDIYTFWDYQAGAWQKNNGIRIDFQLLSPEAADRLRSTCDRKARPGLGKAVRPRAGGHRPRHATGLGR